MSESESKPFWLKCKDCSHLWIAFYYPISLDQFDDLYKRNKLCPECASSKVVLAKQEDGQLLESRVKVCPYCGIESDHYE